MGAKKEEDSKILAIACLYLVLAICQTLPYTFLGYFIKYILEISVIPIFPNEEMEALKEITSLV